MRDEYTEERRVWLGTLQCKVDQLPTMDDMRPRAGWTPIVGSFCFFAFSILLVLSLMAVLL
jgi:hypothetical protein